MSAEYGQFLGRRPEAYSQNEEVLTSGNTEVVVSPLGAMIMEWRVGGIDVLFPLQTIEDKLRGGNPFLFPNPGPPNREGELASLPQHGFARDMVWSGWSSSSQDITRQDITSQEIRGKNLAKKDTIVLGLSAREDTRNIYPYNFGLAAEIKAREGVLAYDIGVANRDKKMNMPFVLGLHPYFQLPSLEVLPGIRTNIPGFKPELEALKGSLICDPPEEDIRIEIPEWGVITMASSEEFKKLIVWTDGRGPYLCVEPWTSGPFTIDEPKERITLQPGEYEQFLLTMQFQPA